MTGGKPYVMKSGRLPRVAVIGCGYWGRNLVRNFHQLRALRGVCDASPVAETWVQQEFPDVQFFNERATTLTTPDIDAVVIATPSETHQDFVAEALAHNKHVYVEKPFTLSTQLGRELIQEARTKGLILMVGHLLMYHPAVFRLREMIRRGELGQVTYVESTRLNWNTKRADSNVMWDLAPHDISLVSYVLDQAPLHLITATGVNTCRHVDEKVDQAELWIEFHHDIRCRIQVSWAYPVKQVRLIVGGTQGMAVFDDTQPPDRKLLFYPPDTPQLGHPIDILPVEPLRVECQHFLNAIQAGCLPRSDGQNGLEIVNLIEAAEALM